MCGRRNVKVASLVMMVGFFRSQRFHKSGTASLCLLSYDVVNEFSEKQIHWAVGVVEITTTYNID